MAIYYVTPIPSGTRGDRYRQWFQSTPRVSSGSSPTRLREGKPTDALRDKGIAPQPAARRGAHLWKKKKKKKKKKKPTDALRVDSHGDCPRSKQNKQQKGTKQ